MKIMVVDDSPTSQRLVISEIRDLGYLEFDDWIYCKFRMTLK
jgi:hypothetical protein